MLTVTGTPSGGIVELNWFPAAHPNGVIRYDIVYKLGTSSSENTVMSMNNSYFTLTLPNEFMTYSVRVVAVNTNGLGSAESNVVQVCPGRDRQGVWCTLIHVHDNCPTNLMCTCIL